MGISQGVIFGLLAMIGFGMSNAMSRIPSQALGGIKTIFYRGLGVNILQFFILIFLFPKVIVWQGVLIAFVIAIFSYLPIMFFYKGLNLGKVGLISPVANSSAIVTILLAVVFFREALNFSQIASGVLIIIGIVFLSVNFKELKNSQLFKISSGVPFALAACIGWGIFFFVLKYPVTLIGPILTSVIIQFFILIISAIHLRATRTDFSLPAGFAKYFIPIALFSVLGPLAYNYGIKTSAVSLVAMFYMANPLLATVYARIAYKEKLSVQQYAAICVIIIGVAGISLLK
jgi:drug/metabolite transporter (DMT)-like permease